MLLGRRTERYWALRVSYSRGSGIVAISIGGVYLGTHNTMKGYYLLVLGMARGYGPAGGSKDCRERLQITSRL